jgi:hypothetical protein
MIIARHPDARPELFASAATWRFAKTARVVRLSQQFFRATVLGQEK